MHVQSCWFASKTLLSVWCSCCRPRRWILKSLKPKIADSIVNAASEEALPYWFCRWSKRGDSRSYLKKSSKRFEWRVVFLHFQSSPLCEFVRHKRGRSWNKLLNVLDKSSKSAMKLELYHFFPKLENESNMRKVGGELSTLTRLLIVPHADFLKRHF